MIWYNKPEVLKIGGDTHTVTWSQMDNNQRLANFWYLNAAGTEYKLWECKVYAVHLRKNFRADVREWQQHGSKRRRKNKA
jgi:uncharacterized protein YfiM (DUF2279 family)